MRVHTTYRTVILQMFPTPKQEKLLKKSMDNVFKFLELSRFELSKMMYEKFKEEGIEPRMLALLVQRFTGSLGDKAILCFDKNNSKFVNENGIWYVELKLGRGRDSRERILIARSDNEYYDAIEDLSTFPFVITREADKWFVYVSIPVKTVKTKDFVVGINFNMGKWVAAPYEGRPIFFDVRDYEERIDELERKIGRAYQKKDYDRARELHRKITEITKHAHGNFLKALKEKYGLCTLAIPEIKTMYRYVEAGNKMFNIWLYKKVAMRKFALRAMAKGFFVLEVSPARKSRICHRCGEELKITGRGKLVECENCGLKDYNRDLNAARNLAKKGMEVLSSAS